MKEDKNIEKLIKASLREEKAPEGFSDKIMQQIEALDQKEEKAIASLMQKHVLEQPSADFTAQVMSSIETVAAVETASASAEMTTSKSPVIIGKKAWTFIVAAVIGFIYYAWSSTSTSGAEEPGIIEGFLSKMEGTVSFELPAILTNPMLGLSLFALSSLLFADYLIRNRKTPLHIGS